MRRRRIVQACLLTALVVVAAAPSAAATIALHGRVVDGDGAPVARAAVRLVPAVGRYAFARLELEARPEPAAADRTMTGDDGRFRLAVPEPGSWWVKIDADGFVPVDARLEAVIEEAELPTARLAPAAEVEVRVRSEDGRPLAGARLATQPEGGSGLWRPRSWRGAVDGEGTARLPRPRGGGLQLAAHHLGYLEALHDDVRSGSVDVRLRRGVTLPVVVRDAAGRPVADVVMRVGEGRFLVGETDAQGRLEVTAPRAASGPVGGAPAAGTPAAGTPAADVSFDVLAADLRTTGSRLPAVTGEAPPAPFFVDLPGSTPVDGRVVSATTREAVAGALVWIYGRAGTLVRSDATGSFRLPQVEGGSVWLRAAAPGYLQTQVRLPIAAGEVNPAPTLVLEPAAEIAGRVVNEDGLPIAGAELAATFQSGSRRLPNSVVERGGAAAHSDARGRFRLRRLIPGAPYYLFLERSGFARQRRDIGAPGTGESAEIELVLRRGSRGIGRVVDAEERPVAGAEVTSRRAEAAAEMALRLSTPRDVPVLEERTTSDAQGRFETARLAPGRYLFEVAAVGYAPVSVLGIEVPRGAAEVDLGTVVLAPGVAVGGRVVDTRGRPLAGAGIFVVDHGTWRPARSGEPAAESGEDGRFVIADRRGGERLDVTARRDGFLDAELSGVDAPPPAPLLLTLETASWISGRVLDPAGEAVAGAYLRLMATGPSARRARRNGWTARSDAEGRFEITGLVPGTGLLSVFADGWQVAELPRVEIPAGGLRDLEVRLERGADIVGIVLDPQGRPAAGARVHASRSSPIPSFYATSDGDGAFRLGGLGAGPVTLVASHPDYRTASLQHEVAAGENRVELRLAAGSALSGVVVDDLGRPVSGAMVELRGSSWQLPVASGPDGAFELPAMADGTYTLRVEHTDFAAAHLEDVAVAGHPVRGLVVELSPGATILGRLLGVAPEELSTVRIQATTEGPQGGSQRQGEVDYESRYRISHAMAGDWVVKARTRDGRKARGETAVRPGDREVVLDLDLGQGHTLSGRVLQGGRPAGGVRIQLLGPIYGEARSDYLGRYRRAGLSDGAYDIQVRRQSLVHQRKIELSADLELDLLLETAHLGGRAIDEVGAPVAGVRVDLEPAEPPPSGSSDYGMAWSLADGGFGFGEVAAGRWKVVAHKAGYATAEVPVDLVAGLDLTDLELRLAPAAGLWLTMTRAVGPAGISHVKAALLDAAGQPVLADSYAVDGEGRAHLPAVPPGTWQLLVSASGVATVQLAVTVPGDSPRLVLQPGSGLQVEVPELADAEDEVHAELRRADGRLLRSFSGKEVLTRLPVRGGRAYAGGLSAGTWSVSVHAADGRVWTSEVVVAAGKMASVRLE